MATQQVQAAADVEYIDTSRYERIEGQLVERPLPSRRHAEVQLNATLLLRQVTQQHGLKAYQEWTLDEVDMPEHNWMTPDVLVSMPGELREASNGHLLPPAFLAVEVLSPGQTIPQMMKKARRFLRWGVQHVWLIEPEQNFGLMAEDGTRPALVSDDGTLEAGPIVVSMADVLKHEE